ncbi:DUF2917 domain-containing protein [Azohydromonas sp. G-1-1-14]|uniref:DUF2917 domain-containing protein n=2 Tax=Azohydromonas caseinilytica TaxID=2728836 RepID=A0A848F5I5_9BURK|nr:DUF2917 domain-containing protein [Azohydromonas caseinilytica]
MPETQWSSAAAAPVWTLARRQARHLGAARQTRWLRVLEGELWLTRTATDAAASEDLWLRAGDRLALAPGAEFVAEGWRDSRFELLLAAPAARPRAAAGLLRRLRAALRPQGLPVGLAG